MFANGETIPAPSGAIRLYVHEATRVYCDKLVNVEDKRAFEILLLEALRKNIPVNFYVLRGYSILKILCKI